MRRLIPFLLLPVLVIAALAGCGANSTAPRAAASPSAAAPSDPGDDTTDDGDARPDCAPVDGDSPAGLLTGSAVFAGATATYAHRTFAAARCQSDPDRPVDLDAGCAGPFPFLSAGEMPYAHTLLGVGGATEMGEATLTGQGRALHEIVVGYADAKSAAASFPYELAKACAGSSGPTYQLAGVDANGAAITSMVATAGAKLVVVEFDGDGWADTDYSRVLGLALTAAG